MLLRFSFTAFLVFAFLSPPDCFAQDATIHARVSASSVRVRASGTTRSAIVTTLKKDFEVVVVEEKNGWSRIRAGDTEGWIKSTLLEKMESAVRDEGSSGAGKGSGTIDLYTDQPVPDLDALEPVAFSPGLEGAVLLDAAITVDGTELRAYPGSQAAVLLLLPERALVTVLDRNERWVKCEYGGMTGWVPREVLSLRGTRSLPGENAAASSKRDDAMRAAVEQIAGTELRDEAAALVESERRLRASLFALEDRAERSGGSSLGISASSEHFLRTLQDDAMTLGMACSRVETLSENGSSEAERSAALHIAAEGRATLRHFEETLGRARSAPPSAALLYGGQFSFAFGSHTRTTIYDYSTSAPTLQSTAWMNTPTYGNFRARLDYVDDIVTTRFTRMNAGVDWRLPMVTQQWSARVNLFRYDDELPTNTYGLFDLHAGWEQLRQSGPAVFARAMYQGKAFEETQPQEFSAFSFNTGIRSMATMGSSYEVNVLNRYQSSDDMGLNFDMITAFGLWRGEDGFSLRPAYEGYFTLADSGAAFLNYHRPGLEARWSRPTGITDYGARFDYRYHPDAENLTYGQASVFAGHHEQGLHGTNWNALLMYQMNNGTRNPSFVQTNIDARSTANMFFIGFNSVLRYVLAESDDSLSQHFTDVYVNPGVNVVIDMVRLQVGPFIGTTLLLNNQALTLRDNLNNSVRTGLSVHALATFGARTNLRAWAEYERAFHFSEDPYVGRKREPTRIRLGAEATVGVAGALSAFGRAQMYSIDNDTGIKINLPSGERDRDKIDDTLLLIGLRYHL